MKSSRCISNATAVALHRVFIRPIELPRLRSTRCSSSTILSQIGPAPTSLLSQQRRSYAAAVVIKGAGANLAAPELDRYPRNEEIKDFTVQVVCEDNTITRPLKTQPLLASLNLNAYYLTVVQLGEPGVPPLCRIQSRKELYRREKEKKKKKKESAKASSKVVKEMELNWALERNDLAHRLVMLRGFLAKGFKVEITLAGRKKKVKTARQASEEEAKELIMRIREAIEEVDGAKETQPLQGAFPAAVKMFAEGKTPKKKKIVEEEEDEEYD
jgi:translation initiation factor IF-3